MSNSQRKHAFVASQPTNAVTFEAFAQAKARADGPLSDDQRDDAAEKAAELADRFLGIPASDPRQIAQKVAVYHWLHHGTTGLLTDAASRVRIAQSGDEPSKGLLAIYLDLIGQDAQTERQEWDAALGRYLSAHKRREALDNDPVSDERKLEAAVSEEYGLFRTLLQTRAPDLQAMVVKAKIGVMEGYAERIGDSPDNPDTIAALNGAQATEEGPVVVALYQDALWLSGDRGALATLKAERFVPYVWLQKAEAAGGRIMPCPDRWHEVTLHAGPDGQGLAELERAWTDLTKWQRDEVALFVAGRA